ncbi:MAG: type II toxin-antitoxin system RelE/ParE family toxin [Fibrobacteria bacterium]
MSIYLYERLCFRESYGFAEKLYRIASEDEYIALQNSLEKHPDLGNLIRGLRGARKVRMAIGGRGKSGGARVIYFLRVKKEIWFLDIYAKGDRKDFNNEERKTIFRFISELKKG